MNNKTNKAVFNIDNKGKELYNGSQVNVITSRHVTCVWCGNNSDTSIRKRIK